MVSRTDELVERRARALMQHQQVQAEAERIARVAAQARRRAQARPVFAAATTPTLRAVRQRVHWDRAS